jgi:hypothetical protein
MIADPLENSAMQLTAKPPKPRLKSLAKTPAPEASVPALSTPAGGMAVTDQSPPLPRAPAGFAKLPQNCEAVRRRQDEVNAAMALERAREAQSAGSGPAFPNTFKQPTPPPPLPTFPKAQADADPAPDPTIPRLSGAERVNDAIVPLLMKGAMACDNALDFATVQEYRQELLRECGDPKDPLERMLIEQTAVAHFVGLHLQTMTMTCLAHPADLQIVGNVAVQMLGEQRRLTLAVKEYRSPVSALSQPAPCKKEDRGRPPETPGNPRPAMERVGGAKAN